MKAIKEQPCLSVLSMKRDKKYLQSES